MHYGTINPSGLTGEEKKELLRIIHDLIEKAWGHFPHEFLDSHIFKCEEIACAYVDNKLVGFSAVSKKKFSGKLVHYIEFTIIEPEHQSVGLGGRLNLMVFRSIILRNLFTLFVKPLEIMTITPNIRVLATLAKRADFIYPNPYKSDTSTYRIEPADDETWKMATDALKKSGDPKRRLDREGLVLHGSYAATPWLIYDDHQIPWHRNEKINNFAKYYLHYGKKQDREFIVRAQFRLFTILKMAFAK